ncbi:spermidine synthase [Endozoicomonadaceae bacterium StTr2]
MKINTCSLIKICLTTLIVTSLSACCSCVRADSGLSGEIITTDPHSRLEPAKPGAASPSAATLHSRTTPYPPLPPSGLIVLSEYSKIKVYDEGPLRQLAFINQDGTERHQTTLVREAPWQQNRSYSRNVLAAFLFMPRPQKVLLAGLGGGAMVHFIHHHQLAEKLDVVELDPEVIAIARQYFNLPSGPAISVIQDDALKAFASPNMGPYSLIIVDILLGNMNTSTDTRGIPLDVRTKSTLTGVYQRLVPWGAAIFNLHVCERSLEDIELIHTIFPQLYVWIAPGTGNIIVAALKQTTRISDEELTNRARKLDKRRFAGFKYDELLSVIRQGRYFGTDSQARLRSEAARGG